MQKMRSENAAAAVRTLHFHCSVKITTTVCDKVQEHMKIMHAKQQIYILW